MRQKEKGTWEYLEKWRKIFGDKKLSVIWKDNWLQNAYCKDCRFCCGPQDNPEPYPMGLLPSQLKPNLEDDFYLLNYNTAFLGANGCKSDTVHGCRLSREEKPVACGLFPIVLANGKLYLYLNCPAVLFNSLAMFYELASEVAKFLENYSLEELRHISLSISPETLAEKFISLHVQIFDENGKASFLE